MQVLNKRIIVLIIVLFVVLAAGGCSRPVTSEKFTESYLLRSGTVIDIYNQNGSVSITGWDQQKVEITVYKESYHGQEAINQVDIYIDIADKMILQTIYPSHQDPRVTVNYEIKVPEDIMVGIIECSNGNINISNVIGNPEISTSNGSVTVNNINGIVSARSSNGNLTVTGAKSLGDLKTSNGNIEAELAMLHDNIDIRTSNGSIDLAISASLAANLDAKTANGKISISRLNIDSAQFEQTSLLGTMNDGGYKISITTSNGSINLKALK